MLNQFGLNIGARLVDDYVSHFPTQAADSFTGLAEPVADAIGYFLDIQGNVSVQSKDEQQFVIKVAHNPLEQFVKVPAQLQQLCYCQLLCGAVTGALEQLNYKVETTYSNEMLTVKLQSVIKVEFEK